MSERLPGISANELRNFESMDKICISLQDDYYTGDDKKALTKSSSLIIEYFSRMKDDIYGDELYVLKTYCEFYTSLIEFKRNIEQLKDYTSKNNKSFNPFTIKKVRECQKMINKLENHCTKIKNHLGKIEDTKELKAFLLKENKTEYVIMEFSSKTSLFPTPQPTN